jgi:hypothetical protein
VSVAIRMLPPALLVAALAANARADLPIVVPPEDTDSQALATLRPWRISLWTTRIVGAPDTQHTMFTVQAGSGPHLGKLPVRGGSFGWLARWSLRTRLTLMRSDGNEWLAGPLTLAGQRFWSFNLAGAIPLVVLQSGIESAISTPWLRLGDASLPPGVRATHAADSELVETGWSARPLGVHLRADLLACRSIHAEVGVAAELFKSTAELQRATAVAARWHAATGFSLACVHRRNRLINDVTVSVQWRARMIAWRGDEGSGYADGWTFGIDLDRGSWALALFAAPPIEAFGVNVWKAGIRLQLRSARKVP